MATRDIKDVFHREGLVECAVHLTLWPMLSMLQVFPGGLRAQGK